MSQHYLTRLEQGKDRNPSAQVLRALRSPCGSIGTRPSTDGRFRTLWANHDVRPSRNEIKRFAHPAVGLLTLRRQALSIAGAEDQVIITYQAESGSASGDALARLL
jgi:MmyB-like transcription regulator ligand binding domain